MLIKNFHTNFFLKENVLRAMGFRPSTEELKEILEEIDEDKSGEVEFSEFCQLCAKFLVEEPDEDTMKAELKEAFRYNLESLLIEKELIEFYI